VSGAFQSNAFENDAFQTAAIAATLSGGYRHTPTLHIPRGRKQTQDEKRLSRERFGISEPVAEVIAVVAKRQVQDLFVPEKKRELDLERELHLRGLEYERHYFDELSKQRELLIRSEISAGLRRQLELEDEEALVMILSHVL